MKHFERSINKFNLYYYFLKSTNPQIKNLSYKKRKIIGECRANSYQRLIYGII